MGLLSNALRIAPAPAPKPEYQRRPKGATNRRLQFYAARVEAVDTGLSPRATRRRKEQGR